MNEKGNTMSPPQETPSSGAKVQLTSLAAWLAFFAGLVYVAKVWPGSWGGAAQGGVLGTAVAATVTTFAWAILSGIWGAHVLLRLALVIPVVGLSMAAMGATWDAPMFAMSIYATLVCVLSLLCLSLSRVFWGWRMVGERAEPSTHRVRRAGSVLLFAVIAAPLVTLFIAVRPPFRQMPEALVAYLASVTWPLLLLWMLSQFGIRLIWPLALTCAAFFLGLHAWAIQYESGRSNEPLFVGVASAYLCFTVLVLLWATYYRQCGWLLQFGGTRGFAVSRNGLDDGRSFKDQMAPKWIRRSAVYGFSGCAALLLLATLGIFVWQWQAGRVAQAKLDAIAAKGYPTKPQEINEYYASLIKDPDVTDQWLPVFELASDPKLTAELTEATELPDGSNKIPLPGENWPKHAEVAAFLTKHRTKLETIHRATDMNGSIRFPVDYSVGLRVNLSPVQSMRLVAQLLRYESAVKAHQGDAIGAARSAESILQVADAMVNEVTMVSQLARMAIFRSGIDALHDSLGRTELSNDASRRLRDRLRNTNHLTGLQRGLIGDRALRTDCFSDPQQLAMPGRRLTLRGRFYLLFSQTDLCRYLEVSQPPIAACNHPWPQAWEQLNSRMGIDFEKFPMPIITFQVMQSYSAAFTVAARAKFSADACRAALAIEAFNARENRLPRSLEELVPIDLQEVPRDPYDGHSLRFQTWTRGYRLYSIGGNRKDDGGRVPRNDREHGAFDLAFEVPRPGRRVDDGNGVDPPSGYTGDWTIYWPNGKLKQQFYIDPEGNKHGELREYWQSGRLARLQDYEHGAPKGEWLEYYDAGETAKSSDVFGGYGYGMESRRPSRAHLKRTTSYRDGVRHGTTTEFSESGEIIADGNFEDGAMTEGTFLIPAEREGQEPHVVHYEDGKQVPATDQDP